MNFLLDYYKILEVTPDASFQVIRTAYRRLAYLHHPDRNPDHPDSDEQLKIINEAYEVLSDDFARSAYDESRKLQQEAEKEAQAVARVSNIKQHNKKTSTTTRIVKEERKVYVVGRIIIKYTGGRVPEKGASIPAADAAYLIQPTGAHVFIQQKDILRTEQNIAADFQRVYKETDLFGTPVQQPVHCTITGEDGVEEDYALELKDIRVAEPVITHAQKEEDQSFGTLEGTLYAYIPQVKEIVLAVSDTQCFGETGQVSFKEEGGRRFIRKELYHTDCSTYWGPWSVIEDPKPPPQRARTFNRKTTGYKQVYGAHGCSAVVGYVIWLLTAIWLLVHVPALFIPLILVAAFVLILYLLQSLIVGLFRGGRQVLSGLGILALFVLLVTAFLGRIPPGTRPQPIAGYDSLKTTSTVVPADKQRPVADRLISHFIRWKDYHDSSFSIRLDVLASDVSRSERRHQGMQMTINGVEDITRIYQQLRSADSSGLSRVYQAFDTLRAHHGLDEVRFAEAIVSCIQSVRYYLILDGACNATAYTGDAFISSYLSACESDCCLGNVRYGVRAPLEMLGDLKGDCDSRALLLYTILQHYQYDVALLTSVAYKHALIGIHFKQDPYQNGTHLNIGQEPYYLWETTSRNFKPGNIPLEISNTHYWAVSLLNKHNH